MEFNKYGVLKLNNNEKSELMEMTKDAMKNALVFYKKMVDEHVNEKTGMSYWQVNDNCQNYLDKCLVVENKPVWGSLSVSDSLNQEWRKLFNEFWSELSDYCQKTKGLRLSSNPFFN